MGPPEGLRRVLRRLRLFRREDGVALIVSMSLLSMLTITGTTVMVYTTANTKTSARSMSNERSFSLSEAALNDAMAVLANPDNDALDPDTLPSTETTASTAQYEDGQAKWWGVLDRSAAVWTVSALGVYDNPAGPGTAQVRRKLTAKVPVTPSYLQPANNPVWNYLYAGHTGSACDQSFNNNIAGSSRMYVAGNLCLSPNVQLTQSTVIVGGNVDIMNNAAIGSPSSPATRVEAYVGGDCRYSTGAWGSCSGNQDARHIYSKLADGSTVGVSHTPPIIPPPSADFATWYEHAIPGPAQSCTTSTGVTAMFDNNYPARDNSMAVYDLTPASSYICRVGPGASTTLPSLISAGQTSIAVASAVAFPTSPFKIRIDDEVMSVTAGFGTTAWTVTRGVNGTIPAIHAASQTVIWDDATPSGELSWNATTKTLSVKGTIFIDGSARITNGALNTYNGQATLYLSGTFRATGSLCASVSLGVCAFSTWNPNTEMLTIVANGDGGQVNSGDSIQFDNNFSFQGGLYATNAVEFGNNVNIGGPVVGSQILLSNNLTTNSFPELTTVPAGMPSNDTVYAQPNPPQMFAG
jgi:Tfp pilus assembly protein PilX